MHLLLISVFTFTLYEYNYGDANADAEYMQNGDAMMAKVMNAIGEKGREQVTNAFDDYDRQKLMVLFYQEMKPDCIDSECGLADFMDVMQKMLTVFKRIPDGHKLIYKSLNAFIKRGPLAKFIKNLSEEQTLEIINTLNAEEIGKLMTMSTDQVDISELISIGKKIVPIIKKVNGGKGLYNLMSIFTDDLNGTITLPYHNSVPDGLRPGMSVYVRGTIHKDTNRRFNVDFTCGERTGVNIPFHMNVLFYANKVVLNTLQAGKWGPQEGHQMPFRKGEESEVLFIVTEAGYQIRVNKKPFCTYKHRIPPQSVKVIHVNGDLELYSVNVTEPTTQNMTIPYHHPVPTGLHPGISVYVQGTVFKNSSRGFNIDFACGQNTGVNIPLHFNLLFYANKVVLNTFQAGKWGPQEGHQMPFRKGEEFEVLFIVTEVGYQILVNKKPFCTYKHRIPPQSVKVVHVKGDLELKSLNVTEPTMKNITIPYHHPVPRGLHPGISVYVQGTAFKNSDRFEVNLASDQHDRANIALHFKIYLNWQKIALNTFQGGRWGREQSHKITFQKGDDFEFIFIVKETKYQILVNKKPFCTYNHRIPPENVKVIHVKGDLELKFLNVTETTTQNMAIPYLQSVSGGLQLGMSVYMQGTVPKHSKRFEVNFACGQDNGAKIAFHFKIYFNWEKMVLNTFQAGKWGHEEHHEIPFQKGDEFEVIFIVKETKYEILVNKKPFCIYMHRIPPQNVKVINVKGDVALQSLNVTERLMKESMLVPYTGDIPEGLEVNKNITIRGSIPKNAKSFHINLKAGQDVVLHFNLHMGQRTVIRNNFLYGRWGAEEKDLPFNPLQPGQNFELLIHCDNHKFKVYANGQPFFNYTYRYVLIENVHTLEIKGDVTLSNIKY